MPREGKAARRERAARIIARLEETYPDSCCSLQHENALQLVIATVLSAQTTDAAVNRATPALFARYRTADELGSATQEEMEELLKSLNFFRNKSRAVIGLGRAIADLHGGEVPATMEALTLLPGVGRKTANVVLGVGFGIADGVVVDTHVKRIAARLGLTKEEDPEKIEQDLLAVLPADKRVIFTHLIIDHGRAVCTARRPFCERCVVNDLCPTAPAVYRVRAAGAPEAVEAAVDPGQSAAAREAIA